MSNADHYRAQVSKAVRSAIEAADVTPLDVAHGAAIPSIRLSRRLAGDSPFTVPELTRIARYLAIPVGSLTAPGAK